MTREQWLLERKKGIGSSDAPAICGVSSWSTPYQIWQEKRSPKLETIESSIMEWGLRLEPVIRQKYSDETGRVVRVPGLKWSPEYPFMFATVDGESDDGRVVEIKTARTSQGWGEELDDVPLPYIIQVQHQMAVTGLPVADIAVLIGGSDFRIYMIEADPDLQGHIIEKEAAFWRMVQDGTPPDPISYSDAVQRYKLSGTGKEITASSEVMDAVVQLGELRTAEKENTEKQEDAKLTIMSFMGEHDTLIDLQGNVLVTWKSTKSANQRRFLVK